MELLINTLQVFLSYLNEIWLTLLIGFFLSGVVYQFIPAESINKYLGEKKFSSLLLASLVGVILPVCCIGSLPIAITLKRKGASLGSVLAFLVATPATSVTALFVCWKLLGPLFTISIFFAVILMALILGVVIDALGIKATGTLEKKEEDHCCHDAEAAGHSHETTLQKWKNIMKYAFITLPKEIGVEVVIGLTAASFIAVYEPLHGLIEEYVVGMAGYLIILFMGVLTYVCSTASVPLADALITTGISQGQALCYLIVGPVTSYGTILIIKKDFGGKVLVIYLSIICVLSIFYGMILDVFIG